ncbi:hypothetical protein [Clostridium botulinum]|nr:hypothetical protein [Clostridium botulinum]
MSKELEEDFKIGIIESSISSERLTSLSYELIISIRFCGCSCAKAFVL